MILDWSRQSVFGDVYSGLKQVLASPIENILAKSTLIDAETKQKLIDEIVDQIIPRFHRGSKSSGFWINSSG